MKFVHLSVEELADAIQEFERFHAQFTACFRTTTRNMSRQAGQYIQGQLLCLERGTLTTLTKVIPDSDAQSFQQLLSDSPWDEEAVLRPLQQEVMTLLGNGSEGAIHLDESGFPKAGSASVGVKRQYCGRLGKVDNCQVGVFLGYTQGAYRTLIDGRLYLPEDWAHDAERRQKAGVPTEISFQTKAQLGLKMLQAAVRRGVCFGWVGMDGHYGQQPWLLQELALLGGTYIADVPADTRVWLARPTTEVPARKGPRGRLPCHERVREGEPAPVEVRQLPSPLPPEAWHRLFLRDTERKGLWCRLAAVRVFPVRDGLPGPEHWLGIRQNEGEPEVKYQLSNASPSTPVARLGQMSASRYWMERALEDAKGEAGLADYEVRGWRGWHHHRTLTFLAMLFLLRLTLKWQGKAPRLTVQDVREILGVILPKRQITPQEILEVIEGKHRDREAAKQSHHRRYYLRM